ncbi:MAG: alternative ribosome rescue aminoacyl-tRNA hydrolase ArfB [Myxococcota bacterium]
MDDLPVNDRLIIPAAALSVQYSRSGGAGGQHVNTTETRVQLRFDLAGCTRLHPAAKQRIRDAHPGLVTASGELVIAADRQRSRHQNLEEARRRLAQIIEACRLPPRPRKKTKPSRAAKRKRTDDKKKRGATKKMRGRVRRDD